MHNTAYHIPVMLEECLSGLNINPNGIYVDLTFGGGGHSRGILKMLDKGHLYGFDQDPDAEKMLRMMKTSLLSWPIFVIYVGT